MRSPEHTSSKWPLRIPKRNSCRCEEDTKFALIGHGGPCCSNLRIGYYNNHRYTLYHGG